MTATQILTIPARRGMAARVGKGQRIKVINPHGTQVVDKEQPGPGRDALADLRFHLSRGRRRAMRLAAVLGIWAACGSLALADEQTDRRIAESALREARVIISRELFGHYDVTELTVLITEDLRGRVSSERDYGLVRATLKFSTTRNASRSASLSPGVYEGRPCSDWLYLHCGVPPGHVFEGKLEILLAVDQDGAWRAVSPHWRSRRQYSLDGYLLLEGRPREGYVLAPKPRWP